MPSINAPNTQHIRREMLENKHIPKSISNDELEQNICCTTLLTITDNLRTESRFK